MSAKGPDRADTPASESEARASAQESEARAPVRALWPYLQPHARVLVGVAAFSLLGAGVALAQPALVAHVVSAVEDSRPVRPPVVTLVVLVVLGAMASGLMQYLLQRTGEAVVRDTRQSLVRRLLRLPIAEFDDRRIGDLVSRVAADTTLIRAVVTSGLVEGLASTVVAVGAVVAMALLDPLLLVLTLAVVLAATVAVVGLGGRIQALTLAAQTQLGVLSSGVARALPAIRTIRAAGATARETTDLEGLADDAYRTGVRLAKVSAVINPIVEIAFQGAFILVLGVGGYRVASGSLSVGDLIAFILYLFMMVLPLSAVFQAYTTIQNALGAILRVQEVTDLRLEEDDERSGPAAGLLDGAADPLLELRDVSFAYADSPVLRGVGFRVPPGSRTALVGPSGAGKSTILALLERFYEPSEGTIHLGGVDVRDLPRSVVRSWLGYVEQDSPVLAGTLRDNLRLGSPDVDDEACLAVLDRVDLRHLAQRDPSGLDAQVGEDGILLSGGERQRLAIARALLASPRVLLLDEPTASLDSRNEQALREAVDGVALGRTLVIVAHRLATVADADQIVVLDEGQVVAIGRHEELLESSPLYRDLARHQLLA